MKDNELNELFHVTASLQEESERLEDEARRLISENIRIQIKTRLLEDKQRSRRKYSSLLRKNSLDFRRLKRQINHQRKSFVQFEERLRAQYEQPLHSIVTQTIRSDSID